MPNPNYIFANTINGNPLYADRAEHDADGNLISTTYATKAELPEGVPTVTSSDDGKVLQASYSGGTGSVSWVTPSGGASQIFFATPYTTTYADIFAAASAGKTVIARLHDSGTGWEVYMDYLLMSIDNMSTAADSIAQFVFIRGNYDDYEPDHYPTRANILEVNGNNTWNAYNRRITLPDVGLPGVFNGYALTLHATGGTAGQWYPEWAKIEGVPSHSSGDSGKVLSVDQYGSVSWVTPSGGTTYTAGNMISLANDAIAVSTTAGITDIQQVASLPANPVSTVLYLIPEA